jgi:hypothetical protein
MVRGPLSMNTNRVTYIISKNISALVLENDRDFVLPCCLLELWIRIRRLIFVVHLFFKN